MTDIQIKVPVVWEKVKVDGMLHDRCDWNRYAIHYGVRSGEFYLKCGGRPVGWHKTLEAAQQAAINHFIESIGATRL